MMFPSKTRILSRVILNFIHSRSINNSVIDIAPEIRKCLQENKPIVALESTIITHGMPYPTNLETCLACQELIRNEGCIPAVISILKGRIKVGMTDNELKYLSESSDKAVKTSRRDFPFVLANKLNGGTTVSGTIIIANAVGIKVFATGGIGGVHRKGEQTMDVSADLQELGRNPIMVVSSGVKSILDIGRTLEYLETAGVLVTTYGENRRMPAFFCRNSAFKTPYNVTTPEDASSLIHSLEDLSLQSGILLAVPIPEEFSIDYELMEKYIGLALAEAEERNIKGKEITPYLLGKISNLTQGKSLESNIALIKNNSLTAAKIACSYSNIRKPKIQNNKMLYLRTAFVSKKNPVVIGGSVLDNCVNLTSDVHFDGRTVPAVTNQWCGGVGRNIADALGKLGSEPYFLSAIGQDQNGQLILKSVSHINSSGVEILEGEKTASYTVLLDKNGDCLLCVGNSDIHSKTDIDQVNRHLDKIEDSNLIIIDSNIPYETMEYLINYSSRLKIPIWIEPTSLLKCHKILSCPSLHSATFISPNLMELKQMASKIGVADNCDFDKENIHKLLEEVVFLSKKLTEVIPSTLMVTMGKFGTLMFTGSSQEDRNKVKRLAHYYPALNPPFDIVNSSGAGDCGAAGYMCGLMCGLSEAQCVSLAHLASYSSLFSESPVPEQFQIENCSKIEPSKCVLIAF